MEDDNAFTANNGLRDLVLALQWVQENIAAFHGNPDRVTVFGNSAGSIAINYMLISPLAKGLFHRAIMQSGAHCFWSYQPNPRENAIKLAETLNCPNTENGKEIRKCLENVEGSELMKAQLAFALRWPPSHPLGRMVPTAKEPRDNAFFAGEPSSFFTVHGQENQYHSKLPVMIGANREEGSNVLTSFVIAVPEQLEELNANWNQIIPKAISFETIFPEDKLDQISEKLRAFYVGKEKLTMDNLDPLVKLYTDSQFLLPVMQAAEDMARSGFTVYPYRYSYEGPSHFIKKLGVPVLPNHVAHAEELQHLFEHPIFGADGEITAGSKHEQFSKRLIKLWTKFADTGVPELSWDGNTTWEAAQVSDDGKVNLDILDLDDDLGKLNSGFFQDRLDFWRKTIKEVMDSDIKQKSEL